MTKFTGDIQAWSKELLQTYKDQLKHMKVVSTEIKGNTLIIVTQNLSGESPLIGKWCIALTPRKDGTVYEKGGSYNKKLKKWQFSLPGEIPTIGQAMKRIARKYGISENLNNGKIFMKKSELKNIIREEIQRVMNEGHKDPTAAARRSAQDKEQQSAKKAPRNNTFGSQYAKTKKARHAVSSDALDPEERGRGHAFDRAQRDIAKHGEPLDRSSKGWKKRTTAPQNRLLAKVKNPVTGKSILATTAYKAGSKHPAYNAAKSALKKEVALMRQEAITSID